MSRRFVLLDRDGTVDAQTAGAYVLRPDDVELLPGAAEGLRALRSAGLGLVIVTNQAPVARGWISPTELDAVNARLLDLLAAEGVGIEGIYACPHDAGDGCDCRKPRPGLLLQAAAEHGFDLTQTYLVGDKDSDVEAGRRAGVTTVLVLTGEGEAALASGSAPDLVVRDLREAASIITTQVREEAE